MVSGSGSGMGAGRVSGRVSGIGGGGGTAATCSWSIFRFPLSVGTVRQSCPSELFVRAR